MASDLIFEKVELCHALKEMAANNTNVLWKLILTISITKDT